MAVYTRISKADLDSFLSHYDAGTLVSFEGIAEGVSNTNYHVFTTRGRYVLTLFEPRRVRAEDLPFFFDFKAHLNAQDLACPTAILSRTGDRFGSLCGKSTALISFLEGKDLTGRALTPAHCRDFGAWVARMHKAAATFKPVRENAMGLAAWRKILELVGARANEIAPDLENFLRDELAFLEQCWPQDLPRGAVHADLFPDNVFFKSDRVCGVIDFNFACTDFYAYDLAIVLNAWCFGQAESRFLRDRYDALMTGYESVRPLHKDEKAALPLLCRGAALRIALTRLEEFLFQDTDSLMIPHDPLEYLEKLRFHKAGGLP